MKKTGISVLSFILCVIMAFGAISLGVPKFTANAAAASPSVDTDLHLDRSGSECMVACTYSWSSYSGASYYMFYKGGKSGDLIHVSLLYDKNQNIIANGVDGSTDTVTVYSDITSSKEYRFAPGYNSIMIASSANSDGFEILGRTDADVSIVNYQARRTIDYRSSITFKYTANIPAGASVHWFYKGVDVGTSEQYEVRKAKADFDIRAKVLSTDGKTVLAQSEIEVIHVRTDFLAKLKAFFRALFGRLPKEVQEAYDFDRFLNLMP